MVVRELNVSDAAAINNVRHSRGQSLLTSGPFWVEFFARAGNRGWGGFIDGKLIGTVFVQPDPRHPTHVILRGLWVDPAFRGSGYSHQLVAQALDYADAECYRMVKLWVSEMNVSACSLYRSMDFVPTGRLRASENDTFQHMQQFVLDLRMESTLRA